MAKEQMDSSSYNNALSIRSRDAEVNCSKHGTQKVKQIFVVNRWLEKLCPMCEAEKKKANDEMARQEKLREKESRSIELLRQSLIPKRFETKTLEGFIADTPDKQKKKDYCLEYVSNFEEMRNLGVGIVMCGKAGTGKTHLATAICSYVIRHYQSSAVFMSVIRAVRSVKETYARDAQKSEQEAINWFSEPEVLVLDEVGVQFGTEAERIILFEIINKRYEDMLPTILISNLEPGELGCYIGERCMDRMKDNGGAVLAFNWESYRLNRKTKRGK